MDENGNVIAFDESLEHIILALASQATIAVSNIRYLEEIKDQMVIVPKYRELIRQFLKSLDLDITPHQLRHTYATNLFNSNVNVKTAQAYLGHSSLSMTMDIYTHLTKERSKSEMSKYEKYLSRMTKQKV